MKSQLIGKDPDAGKDWRQEEKGATEDEMVGWYHGLNGQESEQTPGDSEGFFKVCEPEATISLQFTGWNLWYSRAGSYLLILARIVSESQLGTSSPNFMVRCLILIISNWP